MRSETIRKQFIDYFIDKNHQYVRSSSVAPNDDPTLLFTNAGMNQFKDIFLGLKQADYKRAVNSQKCIRVSGKHNDLEEVGVDNFHHTFFEMLGNWSFGDYYKQESINWAWDLLVNKWNLDKDRLWVTVYKDDDESFDIWNNVKDLDSERILRFGNKDNFWEMGETGPCGPCSEIHYYTGKDLSKQNPNGVNKLDEYRELWNLVFIQYNREQDKKLTALPLKHVDTGMGLERISSVLNGFQDHYLLDLFKILTHKTADISKTDYNFKGGVPHRVIADHVRMLSFSIADGAIPSNEGRGYVLRRVLRRAVRYGDLLGIKNPFLSLLVDDLISLMGSAFPEIKDKKEHIKNTLEREETLFRNTLERGLVKFEEYTSLDGNRKKLSGNDAFRLYDTYGFPLDLTKLLCDEKDILIDENAFNQSMLKQKENSKKSKKFNYIDSNINWTTKNEKLNTEFLAHSKSNISAKIQAFYKDKDLSYVVLDRTPFYYESGGQVSDKGKIYSDDLYLEVLDVQKINDTICHIVKINKGTLNLDSNDVIAEIDLEHRKRTMSNHTATHMLHKALKEVLGAHVQQSGSLVTPERLRFDYTHHSQIKAKDLSLIEKIINKNIRDNNKLQTSITSYDIAIESGAIGLFGEKYDDDVRVVEIPSFSKELCGGTHVNRTGDIGVFKIISETSLSAGVRRIEALTGSACLDYLSDYYNKLKTIESEFNCHKGDALEVLSDMKKQNADFLRANENLIIKNQQTIINNLVLNAETLNGIKIIAETIDDNVNENILSDQFRDLMKNSGVMILGITKNNKPMIICSITDDLTKNYNANDIVKKAAKYIDGGGGGKKHFAKAGGTKLDALKEAIHNTKKEVFY